jgi:hypothetical protein
MDKNLEELFESVYAESNKLKEERSKVFYNGFFKGSNGEFIPVSEELNDRMNTLSSVPAMEEFLRKHCKGREVKVEEDNSIGWQKKLD